MHLDEEEDVRYPVTYCLWSDVGRRVGFRSQWVLEKFEWSL